MRSEEVYSRLVAFIYLSRATYGGDYGSWRCGISSNPFDCLRQHCIAERQPSVVEKCASAHEAKWTLRALLNLGCEGLPGDAAEEDGLFVYIYLKAKAT